MDWPTYETVIRKIRQHTRGEKFAISFSGMGEPLLNPEIYRFIEHASPFAITSFASNGSALTEANVRKLIAAGLNRIYFSLNGAEPEVFRIMMGGLAFDKVMRNLRTAVELSRGTGLSVEANVSITKANQDHVSRISKLLHDDGVRQITYSLCHSRGGNLKDSSVCDTPAMPVERGSCDVLKNTLFIDWRGKAFICDHDIHGEYPLGDLMTEAFELILERRDKLLKAGLSFKICRECNDIMRIGDSPVLESGAGGISAIGSITCMPMSTTHFPRPRPHSSGFSKSMKRSTGSTAWSTIFYGSKSRSSKIWPPSAAAPLTALSGR